MHVPLLEVSLRIVSFESSPELKSFAVPIARYRGKYSCNLFIKVTYLPAKFGRGIV